MAGKFVEEFEVTIILFCHSLLPTETSEHLCRLKVQSAKKKKKEPLVVAKARAI